MTQPNPSAAALVEHFAAKLTFETDPSDVHADQEAGTRFTLVDSRGDAAWEQGRIVGAVHLPARQIAERAIAEVPRDLPVVTYCWGRGATARPVPLSSSPSSAIRSGR